MNDLECGYYPGWYEEQMLQKIDLSNIYNPYNIWEFYQNAMVGIDIKPEEVNKIYRVDCMTLSLHSWEEWCQKVVWYGNKKGAYLYQLHSIDSTSQYQNGISSTENQLAGHY